MRNIKNFGSNLRFFRKLTHLTQEGMAEKMGISYSYYTRLETGHSTPSLDTLIHICNELNVPVDFLLKDNGNRAFTIYSASEFYKEMKNLDDETVKFYTDTLFSIYKHIKERDIDIVE